MTDRATLFFRILGSIDVLAEGRPIGFGARKQRALLVLLLLEANRVVVRDTLVERLWGESPPANSATALQTLVSQLRKRLEPERPRGASGELLVTHPAGYELRLDPEQLDAHRF